MQKITPCLWFDSNAEEAAKFYTSIFKNSKIGKISRYGKEGYEIHGKPEGTVLTVEFELNGQTFTALNGGPAFKFNEPYHSKSIASLKTKWTIIGRNFPRAGMRRRSNAAG
jgi:predicted 3-demethylubiquinone-9 3-methyltransferase (glyoxalase superfamily)